MPKSKRSHPRVTALQVAASFNRSISRRRMEWVSLHHPEEGLTMVNALDFLATNIPIFDSRFVVNPNKVERIVKEQIRASSLLFAAPFIVVVFEGKIRLCDGAHRSEAIRELGRTGHPDVAELNIPVMVHVCPDEASARRVFRTTNSQFASLDVGDLPDLVDLSHEVADRIAEAYPRQVGKQFPRFDPVLLASELASTQILCRLTTNALVDIIKIQNAEYGALLLKSNPDRHKRCNDGFYLPAVAPKCSWVRELVSHYV